MTPPLITVLLTTWNLEDYVREALQSAFAQTWSPLEILISDDCSTDRTVEIIEEEIAGYDGPHRVRFNRMPANLGMIAHYNAIMPMTRGEIVVEFNGDDISRPDRCRRIAERWQESQGRAGYFICDFDYMDDSGRDDGPSPPLMTQRPDARFLAEGWALTGGASAFIRQVFDIFGPIPEDQPVQDRILPFRGALLGSVEYIREPLMRYRRHGNNMSQLFHEIGTTAVFLDNYLLERKDIRKTMDSHLADLAVLEKHAPERAGEIGRLRQQVLAKAALEDELQRIYAASWIRRWSRLPALYRRSSDARTFARFATTALFPALTRYLRQIRHRRRPAREVQDDIPLATLFLMNCNLPAL